MPDEPQSWADVYDRRAQVFDNPLDICEFYCGEGHVAENWLAGARDLIVNALQLQPTDRVLEVGCGCGVVMQTLLGRAAEFTGVDPAAKVLEKARATIPNARFEVSSAAALPFPGGTFDKAFSYQVFHYLGNFETARAAILELKRVVRPGGRILIGHLPNADREAEYQAQRQQRTFARQHAVEHNLRWLWYPPQFFEQFRDEFASLVIDTAEKAFDPNYRWRMDVVLTV
jgi:SAM-dependent methyltransferase